MEVSGERSMEKSEQTMSLAEYVQSVKESAKANERWISSYESTLQDMLDTLVTPYIVRQLRSAYLIPQKGSFTKDTKLDSRTNCRACITLGATFDPAIKRGETVIRECMGEKKTQKGASSLHTLAIDNLDVEGRPLFSKYTVQYLQTRSQQHRRHIGAWGDMRAYMSLALEKTQEAGTRDVFLSELRKALKEWSKAVPKIIVREFDLLMEDVSERRFGNLERDDGEVVLKVLYLANSNPNNLWVGSSSENISINSTATNMLEKLNDCKSLKDLHNLIDIWEDESKQPTNPGRAKALAVQTIKEQLKNQDTIYQDFERLIAEPKDLETVFTKDFLDEIKPLGQDQKKERFFVQNIINTTIETVIASLKIDALSQEKTYEEAVLDQDYVTNAGKIFQAVYGTKTFDINEFWEVFEYLLTYSEDFLQYCNNLKEN
jgi:hypothetical protein